MTVLRARITRDAPSGRRMELLAAAAQRFAMRGYAATSMRDIAADAGLLAGSMYHHFASKDEMLFETYKVGVERVIAAHSAAIVGVIEPWARLEAACAAHLECLLADDPLARLLPLDLRPLPADLRRRLVAERDRYERRFVAVVKAVGMAKGGEERLARMMLLGALNWTPTWYRRDGEPPRRIAQTYVRMLRESIGSGVQQDR